MAIPWCAVRAASAWPGELLALDLSAQETAVLTVAAEAAGGRKGPEVWGLESSGNDNCQNTVLPLSSQVQKRDLASERTRRCVGTISLSSGKLERLDSTSLSSDRTEGPSSRMALLTSTPSYTMDRKAHPPLSKFLADLLSIISLVWLIVSHITSHEIAAMWLFWLMESTVSRSVNFWSGFV